MFPSTLGLHTALKGKIAQMWCEQCLGMRGCNSHFRHALTHLLEEEVNGNDTLLMMALIQTMGPFSGFGPVKAENEKPNLLQSSEERIFCHLETKGFITVSLKLKPFAEHPAVSHWSADGSGKRDCHQLIPHSRTCIAETLLRRVYFAVSSVNEMSATKDILTSIEKLTFLTKV